MQIKVYQIDSNRDKLRVKFQGLDGTKKFQDSDQIDNSIYKEVYSGKVEASSLEDIYRLFNTDFPIGHRGHSLSVSDVVEVLGDSPKLIGRIRFYNSPELYEECSYTDKEKFEQAIAEAEDVGRTIAVDRLEGQGIPAVENGCYFCDSVGFEKIDFDSSQIPVEPGLRILVVEPHKAPYEALIRDELSALQHAVGGLIETYYPFPDDNAFLYVNDEGKLIGLEGNRRIGDEVIAGTFIVVGDDNRDGGNVSLTDEQISRYSEEFSEIEEISQAEVEDSLTMTFYSL